MCFSNSKLLGRIMPLDVQGTFVSEKINKIRWIPEEYSESVSFLTGGWDERSTNVTVWSLEDAAESEFRDEAERCPRAVSQYGVRGDVTELRWVERGSVVASSSHGEVRVLAVGAYDRNAPLREVKLWKNLHKFSSESCPCTALATLDGEVATVGEDGCINVLNVHRGDTARRIPHADSCSLHCVCYIKHNEIITGNLRGHMKIWDLRSPADKPTSSFLLSGEQQCVTCLSHHPTQHHMLVAGSEGGALALWDLRVDAYPASLISGHSAAVSEMQFHPDNPQKLLTCSASGDLWDWNMDMMLKSSSSALNETEAQTWAGQEGKNMMVTVLMQSLHKPINTLDCDKSRVLCGADNEAIYLVKNLNF